MTRNADPALGGRSLVPALCLAACAVLLASACSDDDDSAAGSTLAPIGTVATTPPPTVAVSTTAAAAQPTTTVAAPTTTASPSSTIVQPTPPATAPPGTEPPGTEPPATEPAEDCEPPSGRDTFEDGYPNRMTSMVGSDIRTGAHPCFERVVIELAGSGEMPGVRVEYADDPVHLSPSDETVEIDGEATLVIMVAAWMPSMDGEGYDGPTGFVPTNVSHIREVRQVENFEGLTAWAIGLDAERDFDVEFLDSPARIVVDIATE